MKVLTQESVVKMNNLVMDEDMLFKQLNGLLKG